MNLTQRQRIVLLGVLEDQQSLASMATDVGSRLDRGRQRITVRNAQNGLVPMNLPGWLGRAPTNSDHVLFHREYLRLEDMGLIQRVSLTGGRRTKGIGRLVRAAGDRDDGPLADELRELNDEYTDVETQVQQIEAQFDQQEDVPTERDVAEALRTVEPLWAELFPAEKERIVRLLVETVNVRPDGLTIRLRPTGLIALAAEVAPHESEEPQAQEATA